MPWIFNYDTTSADWNVSYMGNILTSSLHNMKQVSYSPYYSIQSIWKDSKVVWFTWSITFLHLNHTTFTCSQRYLHSAIKSQCFRFVICGCNCEMEEKQDFFSHSESYSWKVNGFLTLWPICNLMTNRTLRMMRRVVNLLW